MENNDHLPITTGQLSEILKAKKDIKTILDKFSASITNPTLQKHLQTLLETKHLKRHDVIKKAQLESNYVNQIFNGQKTKPSRDYILSLAFSLGLNNEETVRLLKIAKVGALYPRNKRDAVIINCLENGKSVEDVSIILDSLKINTLTNSSK